MTNYDSLAEFHGTIFNATCINILARFVQVARHEEGQKIHLQDRNILERVSEVAQTTTNKHLKLLYNRLSEELHSLPKKQDVPTITDSSIKSTLKRFGISLK